MAVYQQQLIEGFASITEVRKFKKKKKKKILSHSSPLSLLPHLNNRKCSQCCCCYYLSSPAPRAFSLSSGSHIGMSKVQHNTALTVVSDLKGHLALEYIHS